MKKIIAAVALTLSLMLTGCGSDNDQPRPVETVIVTQTPDGESPSDRAEPGDLGGNSYDDGGAAQQTADEEQFVFDIANNGMSADLGPVPQADVIELGYVVCDAYDQGAGFIDAVQVMVDSGLNGGDAGLIAASAAKNLCPEHLDAVSDEIDRELANTVQS